jgi:hypothetical protein
MQLAAPTHVRGTITTCQNSCGYMTTGTCQQGHNVHDQQHGAAAMQVGLYADKSSGIRPACRQVLWLLKRNSRIHVNPPAILLQQFIVIPPALCQGDTKFW